MAPPAYWKGYLKLSLVTCAVTMAPATTTSSRISFRTLNKATGNRLRVQLVDDATRAAVEDDDIVKGYEVGKDEFVELTEDELDELALGSTRTIDVRLFVNKDEVDVRWLDQPYFLAPADDVAEEPFAVIRDAMRASRKMGVGQLVLNERERVVMLEPRGRGILVWRLRFPYEVRSADALMDRLDKVEADPEAIKAMGQFIDAKTGKFEPETFNDTLQDAYEKIIAAKRKHRKPPALTIGSSPPPQSARKVVSIFDQLKKSLAQETRKAPRRAVASGRSSVRRRAARRRSS